MDNFDRVALFGALTLIMRHLEIVGWEGFGFLTIIYALLLANDMKKYSA